MRKKIQFQKRRYMMNQFGKGPVVATKTRSHHARTSNPRTEDEVQ